ncbi:MAG: hypothetical protein FWF53_08515 [Candidatus Azobacteroides sp.]|nr:hypothetical protein [Candidatus Azobacteroides sp.]
MYKKSTYRFRSGDNKELNDEKTTAEFKSELLNQEITEMITYHDSIAVVIYPYRDSDYKFRVLNLEEGIWVNAGENMGGPGLKAVEDKIRDYLPLYLLEVRRTVIILNTPTDTIAFVNYLKKNGEPPKQFLLEALTEHKLVIYGERHREKLSWQLLKDLVNDPVFPKTVGTVFMELQSYKQSEIDKFFNNIERMDSSILIGIYQDMQANGWFDRGGFEFLINLWQLNKRLLENEKIKVVFADFQPPIREIKTKEELQKFITDNNAQERNTHMANVIEKMIKTSSDSRNNLFIVGYGHAYKSSAIDDDGESPEDDYSAANQLVKRFSDKDVFCTRVHTSGINGYTRGGMFDYAFAKNGGQPVAFKLKGSPFGKEVIEELAYKKDDFGSFENNYDGYIYLGGEPIDKQREYRLSDIYTEDFVKEIIRRAYLLGEEDEMWFGVPNKSLTLEVALKDLNDI